MHFYNMETHKDKIGNKVHDGFGSDDFQDRQDLREFFWDQYCIGLAQDLFLKRNETERTK